MQIDDIKVIVKLMQDHGITEFNIEADGCNLRICRSAAEAAAVAPAALPTAIPAAIPAAPVAPAAAPAPAPAAPVESIDSPLVGTFYRAASPEAKPFVSVGDKVQADTVVGIIEAMKVMNEIKAEKSGVIKEVLVENGQPVEYGQPLFTIG